MMGDSAHASGKLGQYMVQHALDRGYEVVGVCREESVGKLAAFEGRITVVPGATNDREVIEHAVAGCDGVLVVLAPWGVHQYASGTAWRLQTGRPWLSPSSRSPWWRRSRTTSSSTRPRRSSTA
jgi:3-hydroxyisobutyrate dehydrogenase-like beta-hydroxyacid dehydrogenase